MKIFYSKKQIIEDIRNENFHLKFAPKSIWRDKKIVLEMLKINGELLRCASKKLRDEKDVVMTAIKSKSESLKFASERLKDNKEIALTAIKNNVNNFGYISKRLQNDKEIMLNQVLKGIKNYIYTSSDIQDNKFFKNLNLYQYPYNVNVENVEKMLEVCQDLEKFAQLPICFFEKENIDMLRFALELVGEKLKEFSPTKENILYKEKIMQLVKNTFAKNKKIIKENFDKEALNEQESASEKLNKKLFDNEVDEGIASIVMDSIL